MKFQKAKLWRVWFIKCGMRSNATAVAAQSDFIVTSDNDMLDDETLRLALSEYHIRAILPGEFLNLLQNRKSKI